MRDIASKSGSDMTRYVLKSLMNDRENAVGRRAGKSCVVTVG